MSIEQVLDLIAAGKWSASSEPQVPHRPDRGTFQSGSSILSFLDIETQIWLQEIRASPYFRRAENALQEICKNGGDSFGAIRYLRTAHPAREKQLDDLWLQIEMLWDAGAPVEEFQAAIDQWVEFHREACILFTQAINAGDQLALAARTECQDNLESR